MMLNMGIMSKNFVLWIGFHKYFLISYFATRNINGSGVVWFCVKAIMVGLLAILSTAFLLSFCGEFEFLKNKLIPNAVKRFTSKVFIGGACIVSLIVAIISGGYTKEVNFSVAGNKSYIRSDNYKEGVSTGKIFLVYLLMIPS